MVRPPTVVRTLAALDRAIEQFRTARRRIALVPTMGALHEGHLSLVRLARRHAEHVVVSVFVNPAQFAPQEDFGTYPQTWAADLSALAHETVDLIWAPSVGVMYPPDFATRITLEGPAKVGLEDAFRPHFFDGVATVVAKLFLQCRPDIAVFGEKDFQQLKVVTRLAKDLDLRLKVIGAPTVRETDGLAMSSRNLYLSAQERAIAPVLHRTLQQCADKIKGGAAIVPVLADGRNAITAAGFLLDYLEARHAETLAPIETIGAGPIRLLLAARLGKTRLIDNLGV